MIGLLKRSSESETLSMIIGIKSCAFCELEEEKPKVHFLCPKDGFVHQEMVSFLCNKCDAREMIYKDGMYICP